jgi:hypothetical protein
MKKVIFIIFIMVIMNLAITSCESNTYAEVAYVANPTYNDNIEPLFRSQCISCHKNDEQSPNLTTYDEVKASVEINPGEGGVLCYIDDPSQCFSSHIMPPTGRMPQTTIDMIKRWKEQGYAN